VLISDGRATDYAGRSGVDERTLAAARALARDRSGETCFHTIALGDDAAGQALLRALAETSACGSHRPVASLRDAAAIQQAFAPDAPLEQWRLMLNELYDLNLSKLSPQYDRLRNR